jgi:ABC-type transport system involved in cytochrome c biogenesis ATPase subunit
MKAKLVLTRTQQMAADRLLQGLDAGSVVVLRGAASSGKTTILEAIHAARGGAMLSARQIIDALEAQAAAAIEEPFLHMIEDAILTNDLVMVDDLHLLTKIVGDCDYPRTYLLDAALTTILADAGVLGCKLVFTVEDEAPWPVQRRASLAAIPEFAAL